MTHDDPRPGLRQVVASLLAGKGDHDPVDDHDALLTTGRLESVDVIELVMHLESSHGLDFGARAFDPDDFDSIEAMARLLEEAGTP